MMHATHVVVDEHDGAMFYKDSHGKLFDEVTAITFTITQNMARNPDHKLFRVYTLNPVNQYTDTITDYRPDGVQQHT
jgi:hypothetical protein